MLEGKKMNLEMDIQKIAKEVTQEALDTILYKDKTFREWIEIFANYPMDHGYWKNERMSIVCSVCGAEFADDISYLQKYPYTDENPKYCPACGARMDGEENAAD